MMLGNFLGDFVRAKHLNKLPDKVQHGVHLHRAIDQFTDSHKAFRIIVDELRPSLGKYAPVALDIVNDHLLSMNWDKFASIPMRNFCDGFYDQLIISREILPEKLVSKVDIMMDHDFLMSTSNSNRLWKSLAHMDRRASFDSRFIDAHKILESDFIKFENAFFELMHDLVDFVKNKPVQNDRTF